MTLKYKQCTRWATNKSESNKNLGKVAGDKFGVRQQLVNFSVNESILAQYEDPLPRNDNNTFAIIDCSQISTSYYQQVIYAANYYIKSRSQWTSHYLPVWKYFVSNVITAQFSIPISTEAKAENMHKNSSYTHLINQNISISFELITEKKITR